MKSFHNQAKLRQFFVERDLVFQVMCRSRVPGGSWRNWHFLLEVCKEFLN